MPRIIPHKAFGCPRGWKGALPGLDWACLVLAALDVGLVHLVLASAAREQKISSNVEVGLGSERGRKGLENVVLSLVFITQYKVRASRLKMQHKTSTSVVNVEHTGAPSASNQSTCCVLCVQKR